MRQLILISLIASGLFSTTAYSYQDVSSETLNSWISQSENLYLLDVREKYEYVSRHIPGAVLFPWNSGVLVERYEKLPLDKWIVVICASGFRAAGASAFLDTVQAGKFYGNIYRLAGGMSGWIYEVVVNDKDLFPRQKVLAEMFTSSSSIDCFYANRYMDDELLPGIAEDSNFVTIRYHTNTTGLPFPQDRASYYQVMVTPALFFNGVEEVEPLSLSVEMIGNAANDSSTLFLDIQLSPPEDTMLIESKVTVSASSLIDAFEYNYFLVITESGIDPTAWDPPFYPGNGETVFNQAMRLMITGESGMEFTIQPGEVLVFENSFTVGPAWEMRNCEITAFIQHMETRQVLQAENRSFAELNIVEPDSLPEITCDFNEDGSINISDVIALLLFQRSNPGDPKGDFNRDGAANITDAIGMLLAQREGTCPEN